jgi:dynein heavy chain 1, cytosolic
MVFFAMKPIYYMLTKTTQGKGKEVTWAEIQKFMQTDFIKQVQELKADDIPDKCKDFVLKEYLRSENWKLDAISKASAAAGYLASWAESQLAYADILNRVDPMRKEIVQLQEEGDKLEKQA